MRVALQALFPAATVDAYHVGVSPLSAAEIAAGIGDFDFVISQMLGKHGFPELEFEGVRERTPAASLIPPFVFTGFHPDSDYIFNDGRAVASEVGFYHSVIAAAGFLLGFSPKRTLRLYNAYIYGELGYFSAFEAAREAVLTSFAGYGFDLSAHMDGWLNEGCFMHTINHPKVNVLSTLATLGARSAKVVEATTPPPRELFDPLEQNVAWAIYPEIAERLGVEPGPGFSRAANANGAARKVELDELVFSSFARYADLPLESLKTNKVAGTVEKLKALL
jgi:hypothetical protein